MQGHELSLSTERLTGDQQMKVGVWLYGIGTVFAGVLDIAWRAFDASHEPINSLGKVPAQHVLACVAGAWLVAAGLAMLWRHSERFGAIASAAAYLFFVALWLPRYYAGIHAYGWRINILFGVTFGLAMQIFLVAPAFIVYASVVPVDSSLRVRAAIAARWMLGLPGIVFGLAHLIGIHVFASIVPGWIPFGDVWVVGTGIAFLLSGIAICSGIKDVLAARLLALMLLLFECLVEIPPIFTHLHNQATWAAAVYNLAAAGACWIFAESLASGTVQRRASAAGSAAMPYQDQMAV